MSAPLTLKRKIGPNVFEVTALEPLENFELEPLIAPALSRALGLIVQVVGTDEELTLDDFDVTNLAKMAIAKAPVVIGELGTILGGIKPADMGKVVRRLFLSGSVDGQPLFQQGDEPFNSTFRGRTKDRYALLLMALQVNYPDFFPVAPEGNAKPPVAASPSGASSASPGPGPSNVSSQPAGSPSPTSTAGA